MIALLDEIKLKNKTNWLLNFDMVVNENTNTLFISDRNSERIWKIDMGKDEVVEWLSELGDEISLSIANDNNLLVLRNVLDLPHLELYDQNATRVRSVSLPNSVRYPFNAIQKPNGEFIVSYRSAEENGTCVSFISAEGRVVNSGSAALPLL